tara:strand:+ start:83 stop:415 length:333 start_codon:yes stop_codon:yes gene_type:complete
MAGPLIPLGIAARMLLKRGLMSSKATKAAKDAALKEARDKYGAASVKEAQNQLNQSQIKQVIRETEKRLGVTSKISRKEGAAKARQVGKQMREKSFDKRRAAIKKGLGGG